MSSPTQEPVAIVGFACRLPGQSTNPRKLWDLLERGGIASNKVPKSRFNIDGHWDGSIKPRTMRPLGGMFLEDTDPADFDASFFEISKSDAISMDPNQRQMLEVVFEGLENSGITLESLDGAPVGCFVGSFASDYGDMQGRDPEDRPASITVGVGRAILANRLSHFLNVKGPSMTIDTACSGSLVGLDVACRYLQTREMDAGIIATSNLYLNPEHVMDIGAVGNAHSPSGLCHTFDESADGYVKAEAVSAIIVKRLSDAIRDGDPIRGVIRGSSTNSDGRTPGIASPSAEAQAVAIRAAYARAGITDSNETSYLECHGTGTQAGDPKEVGAVASVFSSTRSPDKPLIIGSIKSNVGHAEPAAGISGVMKALMAIEKGIIPGNPTFENPSPKIDFAGFKVKATRTAIPWPACSIRRASVNSFGYGGSNVHVVLEEVKLPDGPRHVSSYISEDDEFDLDDEGAERPYTIVLSANDEVSLRANIKALSDHLINPRVKVSLPDLAYTLSERRTRLFHRAFVKTRNTELDESSFVLGKKSSEPPRFGFIFTGQGAQWSQMGKNLLEFFPWTRSILEELDDVLRRLPDPPTWSFISELTEPRSAAHLREPEFSQPLVTALQLCIVAILETWGVKPQSVVGHSSGEIAAAYAAGFLSRSDAIIAAFYRGRAAVNRKAEAEGNIGMLAVGLGVEALTPYLTKYELDAWIACFNSPSSLTVSGRLAALESLKDDIQADGHFARLLQVDLAYHSELMNTIGEEYEILLQHNFVSSNGSTDISMFSSVTGTQKTGTTDALYWKTNMTSPVRFAEATQAMLSLPNGQTPNYLIEIGPSGALAGPVTQIRKAVAGGTDIAYSASWARGKAAGSTLFDLAGRLFIAGHSLIRLDEVNQVFADSRKPSTIIDLPNYTWNHSIKYWHENSPSKDWRFKKYVNHDLLGSKILGNPWKAPSWRKLLNLADIPWLKDHKMGSNVLLPGSGFICMAVEAMWQKKNATDPDETVTSPNQLAYRLRNIRFDKALVLEDEKDAEVLLWLTEQPGSKDWHEFRISSVNGRNLIEHSSGLIRLQVPVDSQIAQPDSQPLTHPTSGQLWYKAQSQIGYGFGPAFQKLIQVESVSGQRNGPSLVSLKEPPSKWSPQSYYPIHPASLDGCFQTVTPSLWAGERGSLTSVLVPSILDDIVINRVPHSLKNGLSLAESHYSGRGRLEEAKSYFANCTVYDSETGSLLMKMTGLRFVKLDVGSQVDPHIFDKITWKPDVTFLTASQLSEKTVNSTIDLIAHKKPALKVLEINFIKDDTSSLWFEAEDRVSRAAYLDYTFLGSDAKGLIDVQTQHESRHNTSFLLANTTAERLGAPEIEFDLVILKIGQVSRSELGDLLQTLKPLVSQQAGHLLLLHTPVPNSSDTSYFALGTSTPDSEAAAVTSGFELSKAPSEAITPASSISPSATSVNLVALKEETVAKVEGTPLQPNTADMVEETLRSYFSDPVSKIGSQFGTESYLAILKPITQASKSPLDLDVVRLSKDTPALESSLREKLQKSGWVINEQTLLISSATPNSVILVLDELSSPLLTQANEEQWKALKELIGSGKQLLWVTQGAQYQVTNPDVAFAHGLFRVIRMEDRNAKLTTLDTEKSSVAATEWAIDTVLRSLRSERQKEFIETEYAERGGILYVHRVVPDEAINQFKLDVKEGAEPIVQDLHKPGPAVSLRAERIGTFESLTWAENSTAELPVQEGRVEVEVLAAGVNFKDVAVTMGIVPENEYTLGYEASGIVKRVGPGVTNFAVGDRVCFLNNGSYANRLQVPVGRAHVFPDAMSFEEAATIPSVYLASIYSLYHIANLKKGQSVLIHSASGGVGLSAIQLAQHKDAEIFVTVGTEEKRRFLADNFGISRDHMFSSRDTDFAAAISKATQGRGVDVILNSLTGDMLHESWRICADGGTFVEIGKKDIVDRNALSMEPFDRNCSFRAMDFSYTKDISDPLIANLLDEIFDLVNAGHVKPISPITTFSFGDIRSALAFIRSGRHIGKVLALRGDASYLIVGGLKGLCGNLAIHMAQHGAKRIIVVSRSGIEDEASQKTAKNCLSYGCKIIEAKGDVADVDFLKKVFRESSPTIAGVIQGAMILRDKPYESMTLEEYHTAIYGKIQGTWALHNVSLERKQPLDYFTLLSSISGIVGKKGQSNYSAANTFLDAFATYRQSLGLPANAVDLGLIEDVGYVAEQGGMDSHFDKRQWTPIYERTLRHILDLSILQQTSSPINVVSSAQLITGIGFPLPNDSDLIREARFGYHFGQSAAGGSGGKDGANKGDQTLRAFLMMHKSGADESALLKLAIELMAAQFTTILRLETEMEPAKPLMAYGLDSLAAVELRNWVRSELEADLTTLDITNASSLIALCEKLISKLPQPEAATA
ncbi:polyketide synthase [Penicillium vulpinum]|uniref:polyketide synthase n=1 Tax=Penicillium vulpinum TaxID=29845 RepID=UPI002548873F|nr:polyketide synthase [Penicillium vulpinum]KAJ5952535.1 polyketide synthase [Penicillium vulpinum]